MEQRQEMLCRNTTFEENLPRRPSNLHIILPINHAPSTAGIPFSTELIAAAIAQSCPRPART